LPMMILPTPSFRWSIIFQAAGIDGCGTGLGAGPASQHSDRSQAVWPMRENFWPMRPVSILILWIRDILIINLVIARIRKVCQMTPERYLRLCAGSTSRRTSARLPMRPIISVGFFQERGDPTTANVFYDAVLTNPPGVQGRALSLLGRGLCRIMSQQTDPGLTISDLVAQVDRRPFAHEIQTRGDQHIPRCFGHSHRPQRLPIRTRSHG